MALSKTNEENYFVRNSRETSKLIMGFFCWLQVIQDFMLKVSKVIETIFLKNQNH